MQYDTLKPGVIAPDFTLPTDSNVTFKLSDHFQSPFILYFYPKDLTSGCTKQACSFSHYLAEKLLPISVFGVSKDTPLTHQKFKEKYHLNFPLLSDVNGEVCEKYGVWVEKSMYGKKYFGIERSTFLIGHNGIIQKIWRKVKIEKHIDNILLELKKI